MEYKKIAGIFLLIILALAMFDSVKTSSRNRCLDRCQYGGDLNNCFSSKVSDESKCLAEKKECMNATQSVRQLLNLTPEIVTKSEQGCLDNYNECISGEEDYDYCLHHVYNEYTSCLIKC